jgi:hypothetical protein
MGGYVASNLYATDGAMAASAPADAKRWPKQAKRVTKTCVSSTA